MLARFSISLAATVAVVGLCAPTQAQDGAGKPQIVERNAKGQVTKVMIDGQTYTVCTSDGQDSCINPREAGLKWGNVPLKKWPGKPASEQ